MSSAEPSRRLALAALAAACFLAWGGALASRAWVRDDRALILENPVLRARAVGPLLFGGYHQAVMGDAAPIHQWRPVLSLTFLLQVMTTGFAKLPLHGVNLLLHLLVAFLLYENLRRRFPGRAALLGALLWTVLPMHAESVAYLSSRSELLAAAAVLGAWLLVERGRVAAACLVYLLGALSKEHALLFPLFLALADWTFSGLAPWSPSRRRVHASLGAAAALVLLGRWLVLPGVALGGEPYFAAGTPYLVRLLTLAEFWTLRSGACFDVSRPFHSDAGPGDLAAWACLLALAAALAAAARALAGRRPAGFWVLGPLLFLLPTSNLLMDLDTLGALRFLYLPSIALAALAAAACARAPRVAPAAVAALFLACSARAVSRTATWGDEERFYRAALACNPRSPATRAALGLTLARAGRDAEAELLLRQAGDAGNWTAWYNLARLAHERGDAKGARARLAAARALRPDAPDAVHLAGLFAEEDGRWDEAAALYARASAARPFDATARWNLARAHARQGRAAAAAAELDAYLRLAPGDEEARRWREKLPR